MTEIGEMGEKIGIGQELSVAEHNYFLGSSGFFKGKEVNSSTIPVLNKDPEFKTFFTKPQWLMSDRSLQRINQINEARREGFDLSAPLIFAQSVWKDAFQYIYHVSLPLFDKNGELLESVWRLNVKDFKKDDIDGETLQKISEFPPIDPFLRIAKNPDGGGILVTLDLDNKLLEK